MFVLVLVSLVFVLVLIFVLVLVLAEGRPPPGPCPTLILTARSRRWTRRNCRPTASNLVCSDVVVVVGDDDDAAEDQLRLLQHVPGGKIRRPALCRWCAAEAEAAAAATDDNRFIYLYNNVSRYDGNAAAACLGRNAWPRLRLETDFDLAPSVFAVRKSSGRRPSTGAASSGSNFWRWNGRAALSMGK